MTTRTDGEERPGPAGDPDGAEYATLIRLSYPADLGTHGEKRIRTDYYRRYLRTRKTRAEPGDEWDEFTDVGCCGSRMDVPLRVEAVEGGPLVGERTDIEYVEREACGVSPGWSAQHDEPEPSTRD
ncbi:MAG: hypothetical protein ABEI11_00760 [Haloarculaceae archaeon]